MAGGSVTGTGSGADPAPRSHATARAPELVQRLTSWHSRLRHNAPPVVDPLLRMARGAALIQGERAGRIDHCMSVLLVLAGRGLESPPADFAGVSLRPKVNLEVRLEGAGLRVIVSYYGRVPGVRALREARAALGDAAYLDVEGGAGRMIRLVVLRSEPPRSLSLVMVEAGGREFAVPMHFVSQALPHVAVEDGDGGRDDPRREMFMATRLGLATGVSRRGRPARLAMEFSDGPLALIVDAVLGHRQTLVYGTGPLLGAIPWLLGVVQGEDGAPVLVVHPRRLL